MKTESMEKAKRFDEAVQGIAELAVRSGVSEICQLVPLEQIRKDARGLYELHAGELRDEADLKEVRGRIDHAAHLTNTIAALEYLKKILLVNSEFFAEHDVEFAAEVEGLVRSAIQ